jgi:signal transduction histidine kinase
VTGPPERIKTDAWDGGELRWDAYFAVVLFGTIVVVQAASPVSEAARLIAIGSLLAMVPWYLLTGRRPMYDKYAGRYPAWLGTVYLIGLVPLLAVAERSAGTAAFILIALCPQCFMGLPYRRALAAVTVLNSVELFVVLSERPSTAQLATTAGIAALGAAFSVVFGTWIINIIRQSEERAELISQLEQTRAELAEVSREAGMLSERDRLASEIHDTIAQGFTSIVMLVQAAEAVVESDPAGARRQLDLIGRTARENLAEARALVAGLAPAALTSATLVDAMTRLTDRTGQELDIKAEFAVNGVARPLGTGTEVVLLRICQEALTNVRKHAKASSVRVALIFAEDECRLEVRDDGVGFDPSLASGGYGLRGMRARVAEIGGLLDVRSAPGEGTTVSLEAGSLAVVSAEAR